MNQIIKCKSCKGFCPLPTEGHIKLVEEGMVCNCSGELEIITYKGVRE